MSPSQITSLTLLGGIRAHNPQAWRQLTELYGPVVYRWARRLGLGEHDAADVVQDVFKAVFASIERFRKDRPADRFRDWLYTITRRRYCDHLRKRNGQPGAAGGTDANVRLHDLPEPADDPESFMSVSDEADVLRRAMAFVQAEFAEKTWKACLATAMEGRSPDLVAADLGMSVGAIYIARSRVLKRLRAVLDGLL